MPIYEFECVTCAEKYSVLSSWKEKDQAVCPKCGSREKKERYQDYRLGSGGSPASGGSGTCKPSLRGG